MKKLLTGLLATATCFTCLAFAACGDKDKSNLTAAADYITDLYKDQHKKVRADYDVASKVIIDDVTYTITWTVDVEEGVEVVAGESKTTIDLDETLNEDLAYVLTATIKAPNGKTQTVAFNRVVEAAPVMVPEPIQSVPTDGSEYKLYMYQVTTKKDYYFTGAMKGYFLATTEDSAEAVTVKTIRDGETTFRLAFVDEDNKTQNLGVKNVYSGGRWHDNIIFEEEEKAVNADGASFLWKFNPEHKVMTTTVTGVKSGSDQNTTDTQDVTFYIGTSGTYNTFDVKSISDITASDACIGKLVTMKNRNDVDPLVKAEQTLRELSMAPVFVGATTIDLAKQGQTYPDVAIAWSTESANATIANNVLTLTDPTAAGEVTLTATATIGQEEETIEITFKHIPNTTEAILAAATALNAGESFGNKVELEGMIYEIPTAYNPDYSNVTVKMAIGMTEESEDEPLGVIDAFRLAGNSAEDLKLGYTVKVSGIITNYNGTVQFGQGCEIVGTPVKPSAAFIAMIEASMLEMPETITESGEVELPTAIYEEDTAIAWSVVTETTAAVISQDGKKITYTASADGDVTVQIKAVITVGTATQETTFDVVIAQALPAGHTKSSVNIAELGIANSWVDCNNPDGTQIKGTDKAVAIDDVASFSIDGGTNAGKFYTDDIRLYRSTTDTLTISVATGYELVSVKVTVAGSHSNLVIGTDTADNANKIVACTGSSITFTAKEGNKNRIDITDIEVIYKVVTPAA